MSNVTEVSADLAKIVGAEHVLPGSTAHYLHDATEARGLLGFADCVVLPETVEQVAEVMRCCYERSIPIVPRGGGTGFAGGCVPQGGVVLSLERLTKVRAFDPFSWKMHVEAGVPTGRVHRLARENGLIFPPDPGAAEQSQIGGNIATNAGGPHAFKYGVTGAWVTGLEVVLPPGNIVEFGGPFRKDVAGYDLKSLMIGSEGTLGIVTAAWLKLLPAPECALPVIACYADAASGCGALERVLGSGLVPAALEYLDAGTIAASGGAFPWPLPEQAGFMVIAEADGTRAEAEALCEELREALGEDALELYSPSARETEPFWRWRHGVSIAVEAALGGKLSEDIVVPFEHVGRAIAATVELGDRYDLPALSWGHAGDGNLHATFLLAPDDTAALERADAAARELFALAVELGGSVSGEHGIGLVKRDALSSLADGTVRSLYAEIKDIFDPAGLLNPGKKL
jgi:glycolate oxidase subunit GlcD